MRLLLAEDDIMIGESLVTALQKSGYTVNWVQDGDTANLACQVEQYDLLLLDLGLPRISGFEVLAGLRKQNNPVPVLILSARDDVNDRVLGLDSGADDYLVKPFEFKELEARIRALLRRKAGRSQSLLTHGALCIDPSTHQLTYKGNVIVLSAKEYALLAALIDVPGAILSRGQLEEKLYGWNEEVESNAVEVHIYNLRKKLGTHIIRNIRGVGYILGDCL